MYCGSLVVEGQESSLIDRGKISLVPGEFQLSVVAPDRTVVSEAVRSLVVPGVKGYFGIKARHVPMIAALKTGLLEYIDANDQKHYVAVSGGFLETSHAGAIVIVDTAERATDIDVARAERALESARAALKGEDSKLTNQEARRELERAMNRLKVATRRQA